MPCAICNAETPDGTILCHKHLAAKQCHRCGEWIRLPVTGICTDCAGTGRGIPYNLDRGANQDRNYHGGRFNDGEW